MILWADSFDHYGNSTVFMRDGAWAELVSAAPSTDQARTGTRSLEFGASNSAIARRVFGGTKSVVGVGFPIYMEDLPTANRSLAAIEFRDNANETQVTIIVESTGALAAYAGNKLTPTLLGTSSALITANAWNHIEGRVRIGGTDGSVEVRLNGVTVLNLADVDTDATGAGEVSQYATRNWTSRIQNGFYIDDVIAWDDQGGTNDDFVGDKKVFTDFPTSDTADVGWAPLSGATRFAMINEASPDGDTSYDQAGDTGDVMGVGFANVDASIVNIVAVCMAHKSRKTDAGDCNVQLTVSSSGTDEDGVDRPMTTAYTLYHDAFDVDPDTGAPWTTGGANAMTVKLTRTL